VNESVIYGSSAVYLLVGGYALLHRRMSGSISAGHDLAARLRASSTSSRCRSLSPKRWH
jgi:hypothetical protein